MIKSSDMRASEFEIRSFELELRSFELELRSFELELRSFELELRSKLTSGLRYAEMDVKFELSVVDYPYGQVCSSRNSETRVPNVTLIAN